MLCIHCGKEVADSEIYCSWCGASLIADSPSEPTEALSESVPNDGAEDVFADAADDVAVAAGEANIEGFTEVVDAAEDAVEDAEATLAAGVERAADAFNAVEEPVAASVASVAGAATAATAAATSTSGPRHARTVPTMKTQNQFTYRTTRPINTQPPSRKAPAIMGGVIAAVLVVSGIATKGFGLIDALDAPGAGSSSSAVTQVVSSQSAETASATSSATSVTSSSSAQSAGSQASDSSASASASASTAAASDGSAAANSTEAAPAQSTSTTIQEQPPAIVPATGGTVAPPETTIAEPSAPTTYVDSGPSSPFWGVWVGAYKVQANAEKTVANLQNWGYSAYMLVSSDWTNLNQDTYYVVTAGVYGSEAEARAALSGVKSTGYESAYVRYSGSLK